MNLEILIIEDKEEHISDAQAEIGKYKNINFYFAKTLEEANNYVNQKRLDVVVSDVFFPVNEGEEPTFESGLKIVRHLIEMDVPFIFNTDTHHHREEGAKFSEAYKDLKSELGVEEAYSEDPSKVGIGCIFEVNPTAAYKHKQWEGAIKYSILLATSSDLDPNVRIGIFTEFIPTRSMACEFNLMGVLSPILDSSQDNVFPVAFILRGGEHYKKSLQFIRSTIEKYTK